MGAPMCKIIKKLVSSPFKLLGGILAPGGGGGGSNSGQTPVEQQVPARTDATAQAAGDAARRRLTNRRGFMASMLTGGQGVPPMPSAVNTLLGGGG